MEVGYSTPQLKALMWCLRSALSALTTSMSMMLKRTWISPSGELPASQDATAISKSPRLTLPPSKPLSPYSVAMTPMKTRVSSSLAIRSILVCLRQYIFTIWD